jgi:Cysteine rich repeat
MKKSVKLSSAVAAVFLLAGMSQAMAQVAPTMQEKMACRSDAESLCSQFVGKPPQMHACLRDNKAKLSTSCRKVVEAHGG